MPKLIRYDYMNSVYKGELCSLCHRDIFGVPANTPVPPRNNYGDPGDEGTPTDVLIYSPTKVRDGQDVFLVSFKLGGLLGKTFHYKITKNGKEIFETEAKSPISVTQLLAELSKNANDGDIVRFFPQDYTGPIQVGVAPVKRLIVEVSGKAGEASITCPTRESCVNISGEGSALRGLKVANTSEDLMIIADGAKKEFVVIKE
jgi:hypothetical protein